MPKVEIIYVDMPLGDEDAVSTPERTALRFNGVSERCHIWRIAYPEIRGAKTVRSDTIELGPVSSKRLQAIEAIARVMSQKMSAGFAPTSALGMLVRIRAFSIWTFGKPQWEELWLERETTELLVLQYILDCKDGKISVGHDLADVLRFARDVFDDDFLRGVSAPKRPKSKTQLVSQDSFDEFVAMTYQLFDACCDIVLNEKSLPYEVTLPGQTVWFLPSKANTPKVKSYEISKAWDFKTGRLRNIEEVVALTSSEVRNPLGESKAIIRHAIETMKAVNSNPKHDRRKAIASLGCSAFASMFSSHTGANESFQLALQFDSELAERLRNGEVVRVKYRDIKFRAGNRMVGVVLGLGFLPLFQKYLELREYIVGDVEVSNLFMQCDKSSKPIPIKAGWPKNLRSRLARNGIATGILASRALRLKKRVFLGEVLPPQEASDLANHSNVTALNNYANSNLVRQATAVGGYLARLDVIVEPASARDGSLPSCSNGNCTALGSPASVVKGAPKELRCGDGEGCLFCDKLKLFADETDARKLLSCQAVLGIAGKRLDPSSDSYMAFTVTYERIDELIGMLREREPELVSRVEVEVREHEMFDPYWSAKAEQLALLGVY